MFVQGTKIDATSLSHVNACRAVENPYAKNLVGRYKLPKK